MDEIPSISEDPALLLGQIRHFVTRCRTMLDEGEEPNLFGMDDQVKALCQKIEAMDLQAAEQLRPRLHSLMEELDELAYALERQKKLVAAQLEELNRQRLANTAYQKTSDSVPIKPDEEA